MSQDAREQIHPTSARNRRGWSESLGRVAFNHGFDAVEIGSRDAPLNSDAPYYFVSSEAPTDRSKSARLRQYSVSFSW